MRTFRLTLAYDGTKYSGWQSQPRRTTLQDTLERALAHIVGCQIRVTASGRTDAGVHALGQVVHFRSETLLEAKVLQKALNAELPHDMAILQAAVAPDDFHAITSARRKRYRYVLCDAGVRDVFARQYAWYLHTRLDESAMHRAGQSLCGRHDFSSFETSGSPRDSSVRTVLELNVTRGQGGAIQPQAAHLTSIVTNSAAPPCFTENIQDFVTLEIEADGFLYNMVRAIVGTLVQVGRHKREESWPAEVLAACDRRAAGRTAPPQGLFLVRVDY